MSVKAVGHWTFEETNGDIANDISGQSNHLRFNNLNANNRVTGKTGQLALNFLGYDNQDVSTHRVSHHLQPESVTLSAWINPQQIEEEWEWIAAQGDNYGLYIQPYERRLVFYIRVWDGWVGVESSENTIQFNQWQHVAGSFDRSSGKLTVFFNGKEVGTDYADSKINYDRGNGFSIGSMQSERFFTGVIDDVRVHNQAFVASEIKALMNSVQIEPDKVPPVITLQGSNPVKLTEGESYIDSGATAKDNRDGDVEVSIDTSHVKTDEQGRYTVFYQAVDQAGNVAKITRSILVEAKPDTPEPPVNPPSGDQGLVGLWRLDETQANRAFDASGHGNHLRFNRLSATSQVVGKTGHAIKLISDKSQDASISLVSNDLQPASVTLSAWVKPSKTKNGWEWIAAQGDNFGLYLYPQRGQLVFYKRETDGWSGVTSAKNSFIFNEWYHFSGSFNADTGEMRLHINGRPIGSETSREEIIYDTGNGFTIGSMQGERYFSGVIDDVRVYNRALSDDEVKRLYTNTEENTGEPVPVDTIAPVITLKGDNPVTIKEGDSYVDSGATAKDNQDELVVVSIDTSAVDTSTAGRYTVQFKAVDKAGNHSTETRTVVVEAKTVEPPPVISPVTTGDENLVGYWNLDETNKNRANDVTGHNNHLRLHNMTADNRVVGKSGYALTFDGNKSQDASINRVSNHLQPVSVTLSAWINPKLNDSEWEWIAAQGDNYGLFIEPQSRMLVFYKKEAGSWVDVKSPVNSIRFDRWQHVAGTFDALTGKMELYINGKLTGSDFGSSEIVYDQGNGFTIGSMQSQRYFSGIIDEVKIHNVALSQTQIGKLVAHVERPRAIKDDKVPPSITLLGSNPFTIKKGNRFDDPGAYATDNYDAEVAVEVDSSQVNINQPGTYVVTYKAADKAKNKTILTRTVIVSDAIGIQIDKSIFDNTHDATGEYIADQRGSTTFLDYIDPEDPGSRADWLTESDGRVMTVSNDSELSDALDKVQPGDRIQLLSGNYRMQDFFISGSEGKPITIESAADNWAVFDGSISGSNSQINIRSAWVNYRGFEVMKGELGSLFVTKSHHCLFEGLKIHDNDRGLDLTDGSHHCVIRYSEAYHNACRSNHGQDGDGFSIWSEGEYNEILGDGIILEYNIAWENSDDGIDMFMNGAVVTIRNNISRNNGYNVHNDPSFIGNGNGFKLGPRGGGHIVIGNIADRNPANGFDYNGGSEAHYLKGNLAVNNGQDYEIPNYYVFLNNRQTNGIA